MRCTADSGSMTGCRPVCDAAATRTVTHWGYGGPYVYLLCERHAGQAAARHYPDRVDVGPHTQVFGPDRPAAARATIAALRAAEAAMPAWPGPGYDRALDRLRLAREAREAYWEYGDTYASH